MFWSITGLPRRRCEYYRPHAETVHVGPAGDAVADGDDHARGSLADAAPGAQVDIAAAAAAAACVEPHISDSVCVDPFA